jgi:hypothetical protein
MMVFNIIDSRNYSLPDITTDYTEDIVTYTRIPPIRLAWGVILLAFAVFCTICVTSTIGVHYFFFRSSLSLDVTLHVGRGTVVVEASDGVEQAESGERGLGNDTMIRTDQTDPFSQAAISFRDPDSQDDLVAFVTLNRASSAQLNKTSRPRFEWSSSTYYLELLEVSGVIDILIFENLNRDIKAVVQASNGIEVVLSSSGRYVVEVTDSYVKLTNRHGEAVIINQNKLIGLSVPEGQGGILPVGDEMGQLVPASVELASNGDLLTLDPDSSDSDTINLPVGWSCTNWSNDNSLKGQYRVDLAPDGRTSLRLVRSGVVDASGGTRCEQSLGENQNGIIISDYDNLSVQATFYINSQSLSRCGTDASECPLMLYIKFIDIEGVSRDWFHGIYAHEDPGNDDRLRCDSCFDNHLFIREKTWYTYNSGNLFSIFLQNQRPFVITDIAFYASGHEYDVFVDAVTLVAGSTQNIDIDDN